MAAPNSFTGTSAGFGALGTVTILSPATGQVLLWDGNQWSNANVEAATGGTVSSIGIVGGTSGMTFSNSPITSSGTMTMSGTLVVGSGGTGLTTLNVGRIPFGAGTSPLGSTNNLFYDSANDRLGILTTSPEFPLHVGNGSTNKNTLAIFQSGDSTARISFKDPSTTTNSQVGVGAVGNDLKLFSRNIDYTWATSDGTDGQVLTTDGSGNLSFTTVSGGGGSGIGGSISTNQIAFGSGTDTITGSSDFFRASGGGSDNTLYVGPDAVGGSGNGGRLIVGKTSAPLQGRVFEAQAANSLGFVGKFSNLNSGNALIQFENNGTTGAPIIGSQDNNLILETTTTGGQIFFEVDNSQAAMILQSNKNMRMIGKLADYNDTPPADGQVLIGNTAGGTFDAATLTAGDGISITDGAGSIEIAQNGGGRFSFNIIPGAAAVTSVTVTDSRTGVIGSSNTIVFSIEVPSTCTVTEPFYISSRTAGTSFTVEGEIGNSDSTTKTGYVNYMTL
jgi:hypothetical protein